MPLLFSAQLIFFGLGFLAGAVGIVVVQRLQPQLDNAQAVLEQVSGQYAQIMSLVEEAKKDPKVMIHIEGSVSGSVKVAGRDVIEHSVVDDPSDQVVEEPPLSRESPEPSPPAEADLPMDLLVTPERIAGLWDSMDQIYDQIVEEPRRHFRGTVSLLADLREARELLLSGAEHFDEAESKLLGIRSRLRLESQVNRWLRTVGRRLVAYLVAWLAVLLLLLVVRRPIVDMLARLLPVDWALAVGYGVLGALGGVLNALQVYLRSVVRRDFDPIHARWYISTPLVGLVIGALVSLIFFAFVDPSGFAPRLVNLALSGLVLIAGAGQDRLFAGLDYIVTFLSPSSDDTLADTVDS